MRHDHAYQAVAVTGPFGDSYFLADAQGKVTVRELTDDEHLPWGSNARIAVPGVDSTTGRMLGRTSTRIPLEIHQARNRVWEWYSGSLDLDSAEVLELVANHRPPHWVFRDGSTTYVRQAALTPTPEGRLPELANSSVAKHGDSRILGDGWLGWGADRVSPPPRPGPDLRLARRLPWISFPRGEELDEFWEAPASLHPIRYVRPIVQRVWLACVWVIGPLAVLTCVLRRRRFSLRLLLVAPVLVGAMLMIGSGTTGRFERDRWFDWNFSPVRRWVDLPGKAPQELRDPTRWELAVQYAPPVAAVGWWLAALARRRWREGTVGLVVLLLGTTCVDATLLALDARTTPLAADEFYAWGGLPLVFWPGLLATSWCLVPLVPACGAVKWFLRRRQPKPAASG